MSDITDILDTLAEQRCCEHGIHNAALANERAERAIIAYAERLATEARLDEQQNLGFDKRLDNPILYCDGDKTISQENRIAALSATLTKESHQ